MEPSIICEEYKEFSYQVKTRITKRLNCPSEMHPSLYVLDIQSMF